MKKGLILWILPAVCGCAAYQVARVPQPHGAYVPAIYAAAQISEPAARNQTLRNLAYRKDLTEKELDYMVSLLAIRKGTSQQIKDVLLTILNNPAATFQTKQKISGVLPNLGLLPLDQKEIVDALAAHPDNTPTEETQTPPLLPSAN